MKLISHRGNVDGPNSALENNPEVILERIFEGYDVEILDIDTYKTEAQLYGIRSVPVTIIEEDGKEIGRFVGTQPKSTIINVLK